MARRSNRLNLGVQSYPVLSLRDQVLFPGVVLTVGVARARSLKAIELAQKGDRTLWVVSQKTGVTENPSIEELCAIGTIAEMLHTVSLPDGSIRVILRGIERAQMSRPVDEHHVEVSLLSKLESDKKEEIALRRIAVDEFVSLAGRHKSIPAESVETVIHANGLEDTIFHLGHFLPLSIAERQLILESESPIKVLKQIRNAISNERELLDLEDKLRAQVETEVRDTQRQFYLREQLRVIQRELGQDSELQPEISGFRRKIKELNLPSDVYDVAEFELRKLEKLDSLSSETHVVRSYLDTLLSIPWGTSTPDSLDLAKATRILDENHYGLEVVKERVQEFLSVRQLKGSQAGAILCFVGPPGVGKTSLARTIAKALGRQFGQLALGGVRDEAEIRGHRRSYVGARPGRIVQTIRNTKSMNPVIVLDEIDKLTHGMAGDPMSAMLEVLDPEQNTEFVDHYLEVPINLSQVLFIATANILDTLPQPLLDRMEFIEFPGYTEVERVQIAKNHILASVREEIGLRDQMPVLTDEAYHMLATDYTRESGVRAIRREFAKLGRKLARMIALGQTIPTIIDVEELRDLLGQPPISPSPVNESPEIGTSHGLVVTGYGGDRMQVEVSLTKPIGPEPKLTLTGAVGPVLNESVQAALTCVRRLLDQKGIDSRFDVHVHLPQAAIPKDGPSAGVTVAIALYSAFTGRAVRRDVAMTGEVTLRGHVLPVGGLREKILAARRYGYRTVIFPGSQESEVSSLPTEVYEGLLLQPIHEITEGIEVALDYAQTVNIL
jgi:ATP-dependent Lon protease